MKKGLLYFAITSLLFVNTIFGQQPEYQGTFEELFVGPSDPKLSDQWLTTMKKWKVDERKRLNYNDSEYLRPQLGWIKNTFIYIQMMAHDRYFYDPDTRKYTVERFLNDLKNRYGGIDAVLIWPTYPNIGIDDRNQYDLVQDMPGGIDAIKHMITDFKRRGVRVFFPIMFWDHGTRKVNLSMSVALVEEMKNLGADGMNGDTMFGVTKDFKIAADSIGYPLVWQPELSIGLPKKFKERRKSNSESDNTSETLKLKSLEWNLSSWGYFFPYQASSVPGISVYKWLEPRHKVFVTNRWAIDKTDDLQYAFFNGSGYNAWENIWGIWNQIPERYAEAIRRIAAIYRQFPNIWNNTEWQPFTPTLQEGIYASKFPSFDKTIYTIVNRDSSDVQGEQLKLPYHEEMKYYDVWNGMELMPQRKEDSIYLSFSIESRGYAAILAIKTYALDEKFNLFLSKMQTQSMKGLTNFSDNWNIPLQQIVSIDKTKPAGKKPKGMVWIPEAKEYVFESKGVMIEGDQIPNAIGVQHPWEKHPSRSQKHTMNIPAFYIDQYPITNEQFKNFVVATNYRPEDSHNFLKDWKNGTYPEGWAKRPVTWVSLEDARAYALWAGKRLPHEWEWQFAAQGQNENRLYPWGNDMDDTKMPAMDSIRVARPPTKVDEFPQGASPFGVMDMVGNVWQWTDEYTDEHTRAAILKGGGHYRAATSNWYFPRAFELNKYGKYLLMAPSLDRSGSIGFRCVVDVK